MFVGPSSGAHVAVARRLKQARPELTTIVTVLCDEGEKYLSEHFQAEGAAR
jgi:cysteine synthase A